MAILEYKLKATNEGMQCPPWVEDGGYFTNPDDFTMIGWARDNAEWYTPDTVLVLTPLQAEDRQVAIHALYPMMKHSDDPAAEPVEMTEAEVRQAVQDWVASKG